MKSLSELKEKYPETRCKGVHLVLNCKTNEITIDNFYTSKVALKPQYEIIASFYTKKEAKKILKTIEAEKHYVEFLQGCDSQDDVDTIRLFCDEKPEKLAHYSGCHAMGHWKVKYYSVIIQGKKYILSVEQDDELGGNWVQGDQKYSWRIFAGTHNYEITSRLDIVDHVNVTVQVNDEKTRHTLEKSVWDHEKGEE